MITTIEFKTLAEFKEKYPEPGDVIGVKLIGINLADVKDYTFDRCHFNRCRYTTPVAKNLTYPHCHFENCNLSGVRYVSCNFDSCYFEDTSLELGTFEKCEMQHCTFDNVNGNDLNFEYCNLYYLTMTDCKWDCAHFSFCNLSYAIVRDSKLSDYTTIKNCNLTKVECHDSDLSGVDSECNNLSWSKFHGGTVPARFRRDALGQIEWLLLKASDEGVQFVLDRLRNGQVNGSNENDVYDRPACLLAMLQYKDGRVYPTSLLQMSGTNPCEQWMFQIEEGDKPDDNPFAKALEELCVERLDKLSNEQAYAFIDRSEGEK